MQLFVKTGKFLKNYAQLEKQQLENPNWNNQGTIFPASPAFSLPNWEYIISAMNMASALSMNETTFQRCSLSRNRNI
jgi:hypothetical protein